jgi:hypothetical protein
VDDGRQLKAQLFQVGTALLVVALVVGALTLLARQ